MRTRITLACTECKQRNYNTTKDKKTHPDRMETKKYCRFCKTHTLHKETKYSAVSLESSSLKAELQQLERYCISRATASRRQLIRRMAAEWREVWEIPQKRTQSPNLLMG